MELSFSRFSFGSCCAVMTLMRNTRGRGLPLWGLRRNWGFST